ncbi:hypothetical protein SteCoe_36832 [Stentor coeruleus]|uniref:Uncharacterized protein n=1 Tax=Stentor coeruleus TaxID=5963 RepID=A0A1R2APE1_9CILI|nr:hypothetical protein SteCoe_36832 [Stentor coeruleus]
MENRDLSQYLNQTNSNLEETIALLNGLTISPQDLPRLYAQALVKNFQHVTKDEAVDIATNTFVQFHQEMQNLEGKSSQSSLLRPLDTDNFANEMQKLIQDNLTLKKAVIKLKEKADEVENIERENYELKNVIHQLHVANYMLKIHLQNALERKQDIKKEKDIF